MDKEYSKMLGNIKEDLKGMMFLNGERPVFYELQKEKALIGTRLRI